MYKKLERFREICSRNSEEFRLIGVSRQNQHHNSVRSHTQSSFSVVSAISNSSCCLNCKSSEYTKSRTINLIDIVRSIKHSEWKKIDILIFTTFLHEFVSSTPEHYNTKERILAVAGYWSVFGVRIGQATLRNRRTVLIAGRPLKPIVRISCSTLWRDS